MINLIAIDQGSSKCGYAHLINGEVITSGVFKMKGKDRMDRYRQLLILLTDKISDENIRVMAIEDVFMKRSGFSNPKTSKIMGETRGIIASVGLAFNMDIIDINPSEVTHFLKINTRVQDKKTVTRQYAAEHTDRDFDDISEDEADAILIGLIAHNRLVQSKI